MSEDERYTQMYCKHDRSSYRVQDIEAWIRKDGREELLRVELSCTECDWNKVFLG